MFNKPERIKPGPGQESVWDYPRPPRLTRSSRHVVIECFGEVIVDTKEAFRVLETSHPPTFYFPPEDIEQKFLNEVPGTTFCEWKGLASYYDLEVGGKRLLRCAWFYKEPTEAFLEINNYVSFYPGKMDRCTVDGELISAQAGDFYGGWITSDIVGPFKGESGTGFW